jgi:two-component system, response regulator PdtaR
MPTLQRPAVLIVEDEPFIRLAAVDVLAETGLPLFEAGDADEALTVLAAHPEIGLVFTDINMPGQIDGLRLAERVHEVRPNIRFVVTSGKYRLCDDQIPDDGVFLPKPYRAEQLLAAVLTQLSH